MTDKTNFDLNAYTTALATLAAAEGTVRDVLNNWAPSAIDAVWGGNNVSVLNQMLAALNGDRRHRVGAVMARMSPNEYDKVKCKFTKKIRDKVILARKESEFKAFLKSGQTFFGLMEIERKKEQAALEPDEIVNNAFHTAVRKAIKQGFDAQFMFEALRTAIADEVGPENDEAKAA